MTRVSAASQKRSSYSSESMARRRSRVLEETRRLIAEAGYDGVTMRLLADRSDVASATLYNIYGNKETLIATAVSELFEEQMEQGLRHSGGGLEGELSRIEWIAGEILRMPEYARAMVTVYFSGSADNVVRELLHRITSTNYAKLLTGMQREGGLAPWVNVGLAASELANHEYAVVHEWAIGQIASDTLAERQKYVMLLALGGITQGETAEAVRARLQACQEKLV